MMRFLPFAVLCLFIQRCSAGLDLGGKAFTFPAESKDNFVDVQAPKDLGNLNAVSVCLRYFSDLPQTIKPQSFFSLATPRKTNGFLLSKAGLNHHQMWIGDEGHLDFWGLPDELNAWNSYCVTWQSETGVTQLWVNGKPSARKSIFKGGKLSGQLSIILGQDQDSFGGGFHDNDAMVGQLRDVHMWNRVISPCELEKFAQYQNFERGNVVNWHDMTYVGRGNVPLEDPIPDAKEPENCSSEYKESKSSPNLSGRAFTFGRQTSDSYVKLKPKELKGSIDAASVCLRYFSDIPAKDREQTFFSLGTRAHSNGFLLCKEGLNRHQLYVGSNKVDFWGLPDDLNGWNSFCATWESSTGLAQAWVNGKPSARKALFRGDSLTGTPFIVLGQDQDAYGGRFSSNDALVGQLTDVHMWDRVITPCEAKQFADGNLSEGGNVINWQALDYTTQGSVVEEGQINTDVKGDCTSAK